MAELHFDEKTGLFWYKKNKSRKIVNCEPTADVSIYAFKSGYPEGYYALKQFKAANPKMLATAHAIEIIKSIKEEADKVASTEIVNANLDIFARLPYAHQKASIEAMLHCNKLMLLLEQGLGKTMIGYSCLSIFKRLGIPHRALIISPRIVMPNWIREIQEFTDLKVLKYYGSPVEREKCRQEIDKDDWDVLVTTYDMLAQRPEVSQYTYVCAWDKLPADKRALYIKTWLANDNLTEEEAGILSNYAATKTNEKESGAILKKLPEGLFPKLYLGKAKKEHNSLQYLLGLPYTVLIADEASRVINPHSQRSRAVKALRENAERVYLLSGTICVGRPTDMYMPTDILSRSILKCNYTEFKNAYCTFSSYNKNIITGYKNLAELKLHLEPYMITMKREDCLDMPERVFINRYYEMNKQQKRVYDLVVAKDKVELDDRIVHTELAVQKIIKLSQVLSGYLVYSPIDEEEVCGNCDKLSYCIEHRVQVGTEGCIHKEEIERMDNQQELGTEKIAVLSEDIDTIVKERGEKLIIWAWFRHDLFEIRRLLEEKGIGYITANAKDCDKHFNEDENIRVFLGQEKQGIGITLNAAKTTIYYSHGPDLEARLQSMDRNYRIGQKNAVTVIDYVCQGTIEESMLTLLNHKEDVKEFMQSKTACLYCYKLGKCMGSASGTDLCQYYVDKEKASTKKTLKLNKGED